MIICNLKTKFLSLLLVVTLLSTMLPMNVVAEESTDFPSCDDGVHDFSVEKYDENNHWYECSVCGVADELLSHYYDENGDTTCNGCSYERSVIEEILIDKTLMSEGETATITVKVIDGYTAEWINFYKPITNNTETVYLYLGSDNMYTGKFKVDDQTESGIWKVKYMTLTDAEDAFAYIYNSNTYTDTKYDKYEFSPLNFEVIGTEADVVVPVIESYSLDKTIASVGEKVTVTVQVTDDHLPSNFWFWFKSPSGESEYVSMKKVDNTGLYQGAFSIDDKFEIGLWKPYYFTVSDTNGNSASLYNSKVTSFGSNKADLSSLNFEVVEITENENEDAESFIVKFTDGYGNTLSTQRVSKGESAVEPDTPTNELYLFNGWDTDFTNITYNIVINATWILNPNVVYDKETHVGETFSIEVYSTTSQTYTITCSEDVDFTSSLVSSGMIFTDQLYYSKKYEIEVNNPGSYLFYVKGSRSSNTLIYKVKITDHNFDTVWTVSKKATCTEDGSKYRKCTVCAATTDATTIEKLGHDYADEWTIDKEATCTETGSKSHHCSRCEATTDVTSIEALSATGHQYSQEWTIDKEATCTEKGIKSHHCIICGDRSEIEEIPVLNHSYGAWVVAKKATCTKVGSRYKECLCGHKVTETISATGHNLGEKIVVREPTCYDFGETQQNCKNCNYVIYEYPDAIKHIENEKPVIKPATYSHGGDIEYFCKICKNSVRYEYIPHLSTSYLSKEAYVYDGSIKKPSVIVKNDAGDTLKNNIDYTVSYSSGRIKIGKYKVTIKYKGKYSGTDTHYFYIVPNLSAPKKVSATLFGHDDVKITWSSVKNADAYRIYYKKSGGSYKLLKTTTSLSYKKSNLSDGIKYYFKIVPCTYRNGYFYDDDSCKTTSIYTLKKITSVKVAKSSSQVKVSWANISGETGYQISKSTSKSGTNIVATYKTTSGKSKTISATKGKTYYYKVRAYKIVNGKKIYAPWSKPVKFVRK